MKIFTELWTLGSVWKCTDLAFRIYAGPICLMPSWRKVDLLLICKCLLQEIYINLWKLVIDGNIVDFDIVVVLFRVFINLSTGNRWDCGHESIFCFYNIL